MMLCSDFPQVFILIILSILSSLTVLKAHECRVRNGASAIAQCPENSTIGPCICRPYPNSRHKQEVLCFGPTVTQTTVAHAISILRDANKVCGRDSLALGRISIQETLLEKLDLLPLTYMDFMMLEISNNPMLSVVNYSGNLSNPDVPSIKVYGLLLENNSLTQEGLQQTFAPLAPKNLFNLHLNDNFLQGIEFIQSLTAFQNLLRVNLTHNKIERLAGGQFKGLGYLLYLYLDKNPLTEVGEDAFDLYHRATYPNCRIISLAGCGLNGSEFSGRTGIERNQKAVCIQLSLVGNGFETMAEDKFRPFLEANPKNQVLFENNPVICNEQLKWLKSQESFLSQINNVTCKNDPGKTIHTTKLI